MTSANLGGSIKLAVTDKTPFSLFLKLAGRLPLVLEQIKSSRAVPAPSEMIRSRAGRTRPPMPGQGRRMGLSVYHAHGVRASSRAAWPGSGQPTCGPREPEPSTPVELTQRSAEPFGLAAFSLSSGGLRDKWLGVQRRLDDEMVRLALCEGRPGAAACLRPR